MKFPGKLLIVAFCLAAVAPLLWHALSSLKTASEITAIPPTFFPHQPTLANYSELLERRPFVRYWLNSFVIAALASLLCVSAASLAAYRLAHSSVRFRGVVSSLLLAVAFFPSIVFLLPLYELVRAAGLVNHHWALIVPYAALNLPMAVWLLTGYFQQIPLELEEAAAVDGLTAFQTYWKIVLPLAAPAIVTAGALVFIFSWNEFMLALTFMNSDSAKTVTLGVATLSGAFATEIPWGLLAAGVIVSSAPLIILVSIFQKKIVAGLTAGSMK